METFTINELLNRYFNTDAIELGENKPKLSKQLKKLKIEVSDLELKFWGEAVTELIGLYTDADYFNAYDGNPYDYEFGVKFSAELPTYDEQDDWAFDGSCNNTDGCGNITSTTMATYEGSRYCYIYSADGEPTGRFYYFSQPTGFCVADWYRVSNHGEYNAPLALLLVQYGVKWETIEYTTEEVGNLVNTEGFWSNFACDRVRKYYSPAFDFGAVEFKYLCELNLEEEGLIYMENEGWVSEDEVVFSDEYDEYIFRDNAVYADNIDSWVYEEDSQLDECASCGNPIHLSRNYIEANGCDHFCDRDCLENYFDIVEY
jgi:hypothetical protein